MRNLRRFIERRRKIRDRESNVKWKLKTKVAWMADQAAFFDRSPFKSDQERRDAFLKCAERFCDQEAANYWDGQFTERLTENELSYFSRLWHDGCGETIIGAQDVDRNHSPKV